MAKIYSKEKDKSKLLKPKPETISFILNYSKSLKVLDTKIGKEEIFLN